MTEIFHYPDDLEALVVAQWPADVALDPLADCRRALLEVAYHASMLREEGRAVRVRIALASAATLSASCSMPEGALVLRLDRSRPFEADELRRLAAAAPFETSLVAVEPDAHGELRIWGIVATGAKWLAPTWGGRAQSEVALPGTVVHVRGPARIAVHAGDRFVAGLEGGRLVTLRTDVFASRWMPALLAGDRPDPADALFCGDRPRLDEGLVRAISQQMVRRALWLMREAHHGGMLLFVDPMQADGLFGSLLRAKYRFAEGSARTRYRALVRSIVDALSSSRGRRIPSATTPELHEISEREGDLAQAEAAIFELSRTVASLSAVDGAVVLSKDFELLAFGVEIATGTPPREAATRILRALDGEGEQTIEDDEENVGTRHRAAYRFVQAHPAGMAIVVSQDGTVRFVACHDGRVTYYEQHVAG